MPTLPISMPALKVSRRALPPPSEQGEHLELLRLQLQPGPQLPGPCGEGRPAHASSRAVDWQDLARLPARSGWLGAGSPGRSHVLHHFDLGIFVNRFEVIGIANQVYGKDTKWTGIQLERLMRLAELLQAAERDACIEIVDINGGSIEIVAAIRARGEKSEDA